MAQTVVVKVKPRTGSGSRAARRLRAEGLIPAVLYGHKQEPVSISVDEDQVRALLRHGAHGLLEVDIDGVKDSAVIKEMQWDHLGNEVLHVDFARVSKDERIELVVPIILKGSAPGTAEGGVVEHVLHRLEVESRADNILQEIIVNINTLHLGNAIHVKDLALGDGTTTAVDPDQVVVQVVKPTLEEEPEPGAETTGAEPELIRREGKEEEEAE